MGVAWEVSVLALQIIRCNAVPGDVYLCVEPHDASSASVLDALPCPARVFAEGSGSARHVFRPRLPLPPPS